MHSFRLARTAVLALVLVFAAKAQAQQSSLDGVELTLTVDAKDPIDADKLLAIWSDRLKVPIVVDQQMSGTKVTLRSGTITWGATKEILDFSGSVVLEERDLFGARILFAHLRRNLPARAAPPFPVVPVEELSAHEGQIVTTIVDVKNGAGNDIFATVRGLLVRDVNRIGNILYVRGPETIILVDFAENVAYYAKIIAAMDVPAGAQARVFHLQHASAEEAASAVCPLFSDDAARTGTRITVCPRANDIVVRGSAGDVKAVADILAAVDVPGASPPRPFELGMGAVWKLATAFAVVAFIGQTLLLRRFQRSARAIKLGA